jgi:hypothetical protein
MDLVQQTYKFKLFLESSSGTRLLNYTESAENIEVAMRNIYAQRFIIIDNTLYNFDKNGYRLLEITHVK